MFQNVYKGKKVLVTGHTGFKGTWLTFWLKKLDAEVFGYSLDIPTTPSLYDESGLHSELGFEECDVRNSKLLEEYLEKVQPDIVFHLAAQAIVRTCYDDPALAFETNVMGSVNILNAIRKSKSVKSAVMITSDKCYENVEWEYGYREDDRLGGTDPYSASKAGAEIAFSTFSRSYLKQGTGPQIASARAGNVIGGGDWAQHRIVPDCVRSWSENKSVEIRSPHATRPWQLVLEPLSGYLQLAADLYLDSTNLHGESFNFGPRDDTNLPVSELIQMMQETWKEGEYHINAPDSAKKEAGLLKLCCDKALWRLKWQAVLSPKETIDMTTKWYLNYYKEKKIDIKEFTLAQIEEYENLARERKHRWAIL